VNEADGQLRFGATRMALNGPADLALAARAIAANTLATLAPSLYFRQTDLTGRGLGAEAAQDVADYFSRCFGEYFERLNVTDPEAYLSGKTVLEYGPGDFPGVTLLMIAHGAARAYCVDRFPLMRLSDFNLEVLKLLIRRCTSAQRERLLSCFADPSRPEDGVDARHVQYIVNARGLAGLQSDIDLVVSRAVMEHVNDLPGTLADMVQAMRVGATSVHQVDLRSHGHHRRNPLDFLRWPGWLWQLMHSAKGAPNRYRIDAYRDSLARLPVKLLALDSTQDVPLADVAAARPGLALPFRVLDDADLRCLSFWMVFTRRPGSGVDTA
jgi:hypothetical protein